MTNAVGASLHIFGSDPDMLSCSIYVNAHNRQDWKVHTCQFTFLESGIYVESRWGAHERAPVKLHSYNIRSQDYLFAKAKSSKTKMFFFGQADQKE